MAATSVTSSQPDSGLPTSHPKGVRFWLIFLSLCVSLFLSALEFTGLSTALPTITNELHGNDFVWVGSGYALASTALLPLSGGLAEIFGRRVVMIGALLLFALGSALCGAAQSMTWLIAARVVQGLGGGGLQSLPNIILSDLVPLSERGKYQGIIGLTWALASAIAPLVGGALSTNGHWRWFFYLNLPICGIAIVLAILFLRLPTPPGTFKEKLGRMDWRGNLLCIGSTSAVVVGLTWGGVTHPWTSYKVLAPLILGGVGLVLFFLYEAKYAKHPIIPTTLLRNRTSVSGYIQTFINPVVAIAVIYFLPAYYQACKDATPITSSVKTLSLSLVIAPTVAVAGVSVTKFQCYRPQLWLAWCLFMAGMGSFTIIRADSPIALSIGLCVLVSVGTGILFAGTYFPVLSPLPVSENAHALAFFGFCRSFAGVWAVAIGGAILQNELAKKLPEEFLETVLGGREVDSADINLVYSVIPVISTLPQPLKDEVRSAFGEAVAVIWKVMTGVVSIGLLSSLLMRNIPLHKYVDERWDINVAVKPAADIEAEGSEDGTLHADETKDEDSFRQISDGIPLITLPVTTDDAVPASRPTPVVSRDEKIQADAIIPATVDDTTPVSRRGSLAPDGENVTPADDTTSSAHTPSVTAATPDDLHSIKDDELNTGSVSSPSNANS
ncbi:Mfs1.2 [Cristinia sonorae]|uniref:Mfs1.2 n=1 Tax=Cristinia sonorae TaxID=1940300 RepID=A0A8K0UUH6_9AGAR|nr:Mfs1.2 [Cristinia sonorae]